MRWQGESPSVEPKAGEQTLAAHKGAQAGATTRASMVITAQTCASKPFVRLGVAKLITYFTLRRHIARVNRPGEGAVHHGQLTSSLLKNPVFLVLGSEIQVIAAL